MSKILLTFVMISPMFLLQGCSKEGVEVSTPNKDIKTRCINGVNYYLFKEGFRRKGWGFMAPKYNRDGKVSLCEKGEEG